MKKSENVIQTPSGQLEKNDKRFNGEKNNREVKRKSEEVKEKQSVLSNAKLHCQCCKERLANEVFSPIVTAKC